MFNYLKKKVMGLRAGKVETPKHPKDNLLLTKEEISVLLQLIKSSNFSGEMVESVYNIEYKLQLQYNNTK